MMNAVVVGLFGKVLPGSHARFCIFIRHR